MQYNPEVKLSIISNVKPSEEESFARTDAYRPQRWRQILISKLLFGVILMILLLGRVLLMILHRVFGILQLQVTETSFEWAIQRSWSSETKYIFYWDDTGFSWLGIVCIVLWRMCAPIYPYAQALLEGGTYFNILIEEIYQVLLS